ncbi:MAG TPA: GDSL-type esterase/lipase family protein [Actinocrinis sp.]|uniref:GDSL-type esterase/lipase family protein n=1 Tax=Actinocrinis sp. TaxID=1920516 RepID=UPI002DDDBC4E|nr:GDSL-type esterase/lipase family protein [Actinocrinis sp.]HEV2344941.1 GDSL-type esterase/lipase family protein [Actinocrinis sp.]
MAGTVFLVFWCSHPLSRADLDLTLTVYFVCSAVLLLRQFFWERRGVYAAPRDWRLPITAGLLSLAGAGLLLAWWRFGRGEASLFTGAALLVLGLGWFVEYWRDSRDATASLTVGGLVLLMFSGGVLIAAVLVPPSVLRSAWGIVSLAVAVFAAVPVGLNVVSERVLRWMRSLRDEGRVDRRAVVLRRGWPVVLVGVVGYLVWLWYRDAMVGVCLVAGVVVLLLFLVSNTSGDLVIVAAVFCILAAAPPQQPIPAALQSVAGSRVLVAMGDSYMSGEGAQAYYADTNQAGGDQCRRAPTAYAARAVTEQRRFDDLLFLACSGARTVNIVTQDGQNPVPQPGEQGTQLDLLKGRFPNLSASRPSLVIVSVGGNDAGFALLGETCIAPGNCDTQRALFESNLPSVQADLEHTYAALKNALPGVPILAVPYPQPLATRPDCPGVALTGSERDFAHAFVHELDQSVQAAAADAGIYYLADMENALARGHLQLCDGRVSDAGVNFIGLKSVDGFASQRYNPANWLHNSLHPNARGHQVMLDVFDDWLNQHAQLLDAAQPGQPAGVAAGSPNPAATTASAPVCDMNGSHSSTLPSCQSQLGLWQLQQVQNLRVWLLVLLGCLAVVWLACIAVLDSARGLGRRGARPSSGDKT